VISPNPESISQRAKRLYEQKLREALEASHPHAFVAIEPESGDYYLGRTLSEAIGAARTAHPDRLCHTLRVGHRATVHFGVSLK
jgi:hypothetical protein